MWYSMQKGVRVNPGNLKPKGEIIDVVERTKDERLTRVWEVFGQSTLHSPERVMQAQLEPEEAAIWLANRVADFKLQGSDIALVAGGFDVPHDCHEWYLRHCLMQATIKTLESRGDTVDDEKIMDAMASGKVRLIVSIDSDKALDARKGSQKNKGGIPRPVYPWASRAQRIAGYCYINPKTNEVHQLVGVVSRECTIDYQGTPLESARYTADWLNRLGLLDTYIVYSEHPGDEQAAQSIGIDHIVIPDGIVYARDPRTDKEFSSSGIIRSIRGE